jgi:hypothetical protein
VQCAPLAGASAVVRRAEDGTDPDTSGNRTVRPNLI